MLHSRKGREDVLILSDWDKPYGRETTYVRRIDRKLKEQGSMALIVRAWQETVAIHR
jgi:hypothetical protein